MRIHVWKGFQSKAITDLISRVWARDDELLILCPPTMDAFTGGEFLPPGEIQWHGEWSKTPTDIPRVPADYPETPVLGLFTSGTSSGQNRLVLYSKANIRASLEGILKFFDSSRIDSVFSYPQPFHTFGLLLGHILAIENGWRLLAGDGKYSSAFHERWLSDHTAGSLTLGTPTHFLDLMAYAKDLSIQPSYSCIVGGAPVSVTLWRRLREELKIEQPTTGYGATEASPGVTHMPAGREPKEDGEIGFLIDGVDVKLSSDGYRLFGPSVCLAIIQQNRIEFPNSVFISDELKKRDDGIFVFHGRSDLVLNRGGLKFSLEQIERGLQQKLGLSVIACAIPDARLGQELALVIPENGDMQAILDALQAEWGVRFASSHFVKATQLPVNASLKPDRVQARNLIQQTVGGVAASAL